MKTLSTCRRAPRLSVLVTLVIVLVTAFFSTARGQIEEKWVQRYNSSATPASSHDLGAAVGMDAAGNVLVTGSTGTSGYTAKYSPTTTSGAPPIWGKTSAFGFYHLAVDESGNVAVTGAATVKYAAADGHVLWTRSDLGGIAIAADGAGNVIVAGIFYDPATSSIGFDTVKCDKDTGATVWEVRYLGLVAPGYNAPQDVAVDAQGNVIVTGVSGNQCYTAKYAKDAGAGATGVLVWEKRYTASNGSGNSVAVDANGDVVITGSIVAGTFNDFYTAKYAKLTGEIIWDETYDGPSHRADAGLKVAVDSGGNVVVSGVSADTTTAYGIYTLKYPPGGGTALWGKRISDSGYEGQPQGLALDAAGNAVITTPALGDDGSVDYYTVKYAAATGDPIGIKYKGPAGRADLPAGVAVDAAGNVAVVGSSENATDTDFATVFYSPAADVTLPPTLLGPASGSTTGNPVAVGFHLPEAALSGSVTLSFGATTLVLAGQESAGTHGFIFDPANPTAAPQIASGGPIADGTYTVTLTYQDAVGNPPASATNTNVTINTTSPTAPSITFVQAGFAPVPGHGFDPLDRIPADALFASYHEPAIDDAGRLAFIATWSSRTKGAGGGVFVDGTLLVAKGQAAPGALGAAGAIFKSFKDPVMSGDGRVAFLATLGGVPASAADVVVTNAFAAADTLTIVARKGDSATNGPGTIVGKWASFASVSLQSAAGKHGLLFTAKLKNGAGPPRVTAANNSAAWLRTEALGTDPVVVVRTGAPAPGITPAQTIKSFTLLHAESASNGHGRGHFLAENVDVPVTLNPATKGLPQGILKWRAGAASLSRLTGQTGPIAGSHWKTVSPVSHGTAGGAPFGAVFGGLEKDAALGLTDANREGIFSLSDTGDGTVMREGDTVSGMLVKSFKYPIASATNSSVAAPGYVILPAQSATKSYFALLWRPEGGNAEVLARVGGFSSVHPVDPWAGFPSLALPGGGLGPLFIGKLKTGGLINSRNDLGLYVVDSTGTLRELLREGQVLTVGTGQATVKAFSLLTPLSGTTGTTRSFNSFGQVALLITFTTGKTALARIDVP